MGNQVVRYSGEPPAYYHPPSSPPVVIERQVIIVRESDGGALKSVGVILTGIAGIIGGIVALVGLAGKADNPPVPQYRPMQYQSRPVYYHNAEYREPPRRCWSEPRREYVGRFYTHVEQIWRPDGYGGWRRGLRHHYVDRYRNYRVRVCS